MPVAAVVLAENGRLKYLDKIVDTFGKIVSAARGEVIATITTAEVTWAAWRCCRVSCLQSMCAAQCKLRLECQVQAVEVVRYVSPSLRAAGSLHPAKPASWTKLPQSVRQQWCWTSALHCSFAR